MTWSDPAWRHSLAKCQTIHSRYHFFLFHTEPGSGFFFSPSFLSAPVSLELGLYFPHPHLVPTVCSSFYLISIVYVYIQYLRYQNFCLLNDFFLWILSTHFCTTQDIIWIWAKRKFQGQCIAHWYSGIDLVAETSGQLHWSKWPLW